jgi:hypothetical protein
MSLKNPIVFWSKRNQIFLDQYHKEINITNEAGLKLLGGPVGDAIFANT